MEVTSLPHMKFLLPLFLCLLSLSMATTFAADDAAVRKPTVYLIGDSTVKNSTKGQKGWGECLEAEFDLTKIDVANHALGGRSSRSFLREGLWDKVLEKIQPGDFLLIQFGHNDGGPMDAEKARASIKGNGDESREVTIKETGAKETVHSYGWYLRKYAGDAKTKGATVIICSLIPRNIWTDKVTRAADSYGKWASEAATGCGALFLDLNNIIADHYDALGQQKIASEFFTPTDHTHTTPEGAAFNAQCVAEGIRKLTDCPLSKLLKPISIKPGS